MSFKIFDEFGDKIKIKDFQETNFIQPFIIVDSMNKKPKFERKIFSVFGTYRMPKIIGKSGIYLYRIKNSYLLSDNLLNFEKCKVVPRKGELQMDLANFQFRFNWRSYDSGWVQGKVVNGTYHKIDLAKIRFGTYKTEQKDF